MNKAITDGVVFQPPSFADGLDVWSSGDGTPGSDTYDNSTTAAFVPADQDFGSCLEVLKTQTVTKVRYMGETPILPGCYLKVTARIKVMSGIFPSVRIAGWAGAAGGTNVANVVQIGQSVATTAYGTVVEVSALVGTGDRSGVDMVWGPTALYGHFGLDLTGANGGVVRIDDVEIEDVSDVFLFDQLGQVDVLDYGAIGDGTTDNVAAFAAADAAANGRTVYVPAGVYFLGSNTTMENEVRFEGTVTMPDDNRLVLTKNYDLPNYVAAFGDEVVAFKKAFQALLNFTDHESLDMGGLRIRLSEPIDMQAAVGNRDTSAVRRVVRNGQIQCDSSAAWDTDVQTSQATYDPNSRLQLRDVANISNIQVGSLVEGVGVGREIYVQEVNVAQSRLTLTQPLYDAAGTQIFTFKRFKYALDFIGFADLSQFTLENIELQCNGNASGIMMAQDGVAFQLRDSYLTKPKDRGITSAGFGCQGMMIDRCNWTSNEIDIPVQDRTTIGFNMNANDVKIRDNRIVRFKHFCILGGSGAVITGNHWFHGDTTTDGIRKAGIIFTQNNVKSMITGNYVDNNFIEWTNEYTESPDFSSTFPFGGLTITGNVFTVNDVAPWFRFLVIKPYGQDHYIQGLAVIGNVFRAINGAIERVEDVDTTFADLDATRHRNVIFEANTYNSVTDAVYSPYKITHTEASAEQTWVVDLSPNLPFNGDARYVESVVQQGRLRNSANDVNTAAPYVEVDQGTNRDQVHIHWPEPLRGTVALSVRMDRPD